MGRKRKNKNGPLLCSEGDEGDGRLTETRDSEAKGPFPGGKRVLFLIDESEKRRRCEASTSGFTSVAMNPNSWRK